MQVLLKGIILNVVKLSDHKLICKIYTREKGLRSYLTRSGSSSKSKIKPAVLLPLNQVDINVSEKENRDLGNLTEIRCNYIYTQIPSDIQKISLSAFINELLIKCLKESESNPELFDFLSASLQKLDLTSESIRNFHLNFMLQLSKHLGFFPNNNYNSANPVFDFMNGSFIENIPSHPYYIKNEEAKQFSALLEENESDEKKFIPNKEQRQLLLTQLLTYYKLHIPGLNELKSLSVLKETFA
jgi:DNA repair protein RecO (recombination protein O)